MLFFLLSCDELCAPWDLQSAQESAARSLAFNLDSFLSALVCRSLHPRSPYSEGGPREPHKSLHTPFLLLGERVILPPSSIQLGGSLKPPDVTCSHTRHPAAVQLRLTKEANSRKFVAECGCRARDRPNSLATTHSSSYVGRVESIDNELRG